MSEYAKSLTELLKSYTVDTATGRTSRQAAAALEKYGENRLPEKPAPGALKRALPRVMDATLLVLLNGLLGVLPEFRAEKTLSSFKSIAAPEVKVLRDGEAVRVPAEKVVPGDVMLLEAGDLIQADGRLLEASSLVCDESILAACEAPDDEQDEHEDAPREWPEKSASAEIPEGADISLRLNMVYSGCAVMRGRGRVLVTATGIHTELAKRTGTDSLGEEVSPKTRTQEKLNLLGRRLAVFAIGVCAVIFIIGLIRRMELATLFTTSVALAAAALPGGLGAVVAVILAVAARDMLRKNVIVREYAAIETLGATSVICSDKTGTLTGSGIKVTRVWAPGSGIRSLEGKGENEDEGENELPEKDKFVLRLAALCSNDIGGDPTEEAIIAAALAYGMDKRELDKEYPRVAELPFDSDRKLMTTVHEVGGKLIAVTKGGCDFLLPLCQNAEGSRAADANLHMTQNALRVLAVAWRSLDKLPEEISPATLETSLVFMGLLGMTEPPREETAEALARCREAGIKTAMITGDSIKTAAAAAIKLGIIEDEAQAMTGAEISAMQDWELEEAVAGYGVYARVGPEDRLRVVRAWRENGEVVAMTGDSANDARALVAADIGCAMGQIGSDAARQAADVVLMDDSFSSLVAAVEAGRVVSSNIKKAVRFRLGSNLGELLAVLLAMLFGWGMPLMAVHLLLVNALTGLLPAVALGMEKAEKSIMRSPPPPRDESIFAGGLSQAIVLQGFMLGVLTLLAYYFGSFVQVSSLVPPSRDIGVTMAFLVLASSQLIQAYNCRGARPVLRRGLFGNRALNLAALCSFALILLISHFSPLASMFSLSGISTAHRLIAAGLALAPLPISELVKSFRRGRAI
jgi:Ca2+-transporting ATPase